MLESLIPPIHIGIQKKRLGLWKIKTNPYKSCPSLFGNLPKKVNRKKRKVHTRIIRDRFWHFI